jgi:hypothetical protein
VSNLSDRESHAVIDGVVFEPGDDADTRCGRIVVACVDAAYKRGLEVGVVANLAAAERAPRGARVCSGVLGSCGGVAERMAEEALARFGS